MSIWPNAYLGTGGWNFVGIHELSHKCLGTFIDALPRTERGSAAHWSHQLLEAIMLKKLLDFTFAAISGTAIAIVSHLVASWLTQFGHVFGHVIWILAH